MTEIKYATTKIWVSTKRLLKRLAAENDMTMVKFLDELAKNHSEGTTVEWHGMDKRPDFAACGCLVSVDDIIYPAGWSRMKNEFVNIDGIPFKGDIQVWAFMPISPTSKFTKQELHKVTNYAHL